MTNEQNAPYEALTTVEDVQRALEDDRVVELTAPGNPPVWVQTLNDRAQIIADDLEAGWQYRAAAPKPAAPPSVTDAVRKALEGMLSVYAELHAKYDLGECQATIDARAALTHPGHKHAQEAAAQEGVRACCWSQEDEYGDHWDTDCGHLFRLDEGGPVDNGMKHCCYCGESVIQQKWRREEDEPTPIDNEAK